MNEEDPFEPKADYVIRKGYEKKIVIEIAKRKMQITKLQAEIEKLKKGIVEDPDVQDLETAYWAEYKT